jgi:hypothetical protein
MKVSTNQKTPYIIKKRQGTQRLLFYGCEHTNDPNHSQFQDIEYRLNSFLIEAKNPVILVEGHFDKVPISETVERNKSIIQGGEAQFVVYLAREKKIIVVSPEPGRVWEANQLAKEFARDVIVFYYFIRQIDWWNGFKEKVNIENEASKMLENMQETYEWKTVNFCLKGMQEIHQDIFNKPLDFDDVEWINSLATPMKKQQDYITNIIARRDGEIRDAYVLEKIKDYWQEGRSIFVVFGSSHAVRLELELEKLSNR